MDENEEVKVEDEVIVEPTEVVEEQAIVEPETEEEVPEEGGEDVE